MIKRRLGHKWKVGLPGEGLRKNFPHARFDILF